MDKHDKHLPYFELLDFLTKPGCPVCAILEDSITRYLKSFLYEGVNDPYMRDKILTKGLLCNKHGWAIAELGDSLGKAIIMKSLIDNLRKNLSSQGIPKKPFDKKIARDD